MYLTLKVVETLAKTGTCWDKHRRLLVNEGLCIIYICNMYVYIYIYYICSWHDYYLVTHMIGT